MNCGRALWLSSRVGVDEALHLIRVARHNWDSTPLRPFIARGRRIVRTALERQLQYPPKDYSLYSGCGRTFLLSFASRRSNLYLDSRTGEICQRCRIFLYDRRRPSVKDGLCPSCFQVTRHPELQTTTKMRKAYLLWVSKVLHVGGATKGRYLSRIELLQGTVDMLILQTLQWGARGTATP